MSGPSVFPFQNDGGTHIGTTWAMARVVKECHAEIQQVKICSSGQLAIGMSFGRVAANRPEFLEKLLAWNDRGSLKDSEWLQHPSPPVMMTLLPTLKSCESIYWTTPLACHPYHDFSFSAG